jgi:hypothetical protein
MPFILFALIVVAVVAVVMAHLYLVFRRWLR